jgi:hypothetical protein
MQPRPISAIIFGILNIGFGAFNLLSLLFLPTSAEAGANSSLKSFYGDPNLVHWLWVSGVISGAGGLVLAAAGVGLLLCQNWARIASMAWAVFDILMAFATAPLSGKVARAIAPQFGDAIALLATIFVLVFSLVFPVALLIFMRRPNFVAACQGKAAPPQTP